MRKIGTHPDISVKVLADYYLANGIAVNLIDNSDGSIAVWAVDEDKLPEAKKIFQEFQENPSDPKFASVAKTARKLRKEKEDQRNRTTKNVRTGRQSFERRTPIIFACASLCVFAAIMSGFSLNASTPIVQQMSFNFTPIESAQQMKLISMAGFEHGLSDALELTTASLKRGELWRIFTPAFLHVSVMHLVMNLFVFIPFGRRIEANEGKWFTLGLILISAGLSNLAQGLLPLSLDGTGVGLIGVGAGNEVALFSPFAGISGVCFGLVAFCWQRGQMTTTPDYQVSNSLMFILVATLAFGFLGLDQEILKMSLANWAHAIGMLVGLTAGALRIGRSAR